MKNKCVLLCSLLVFSFTGVVFAASPTASPSQVETETSTKSTVRVPEVSSRFSFSALVEDASFAQEAVVCRPNPCACHPDRCVAAR